MPQERLETKRQRAAKMLDLLDRSLPDAKIELHFTTPLELLVAVVLSAQCTDRRVNMVTPALFKRFPDAQSYASADVAEVESFIRTCGLYRSKARNLVKAGQLLVEHHGSRVPKERAELQGLPGVGAKSAGVIAIHLGGSPAFPVDTHVGRLARRMGFTHHSQPDKVENDLQGLWPSSRWAQGHQLLVWHGRRICFARAPACDRCVVDAMCPKRGVTARRTLPARKRARP